MPTGTPDTSTTMDDEPRDSSPRRVRPEAPLAQTPLTGRAVELAELRALALDPETRLLTLTGPGGVGKTRLSVALAREIAPEFPDGVVFVPLADIDDPALVVPTIAGALELADDTDTRLRDRLKALLQLERMALILDNMEQVAEAGGLLPELLDAAPRLLIVVTSRTALGVRGEREWPVPPLTQADAIAFAHQQLATTAGSDPETDVALAALVGRLGCLPLAIELAVARARIETVAAVVASLTGVLPEGDASPAALDHLMRATIEWAHAWLSGDAHRLFHRMAVFTGGCALDAAERVCDDDGTLDVPAALATLVSTGVVRRWDGSDDTAWLRMISAVRAFARARLEQSGELPELERRHAIYYVELAERAEPYFTTPDQLAWYDRLSRERDNLRAALRWAVEHEEATLGLRLGVALWRFWDRRGHASEGRVWLSELLAIPGATTSSELRATALFGAGRLAYQQGDFQIASMLFEETLWTAKDGGSQIYLAAALTQLAHIARRAGSYQRARKYYDESLAIRKRLGYTFGVAISLSSIGAAAREQGERETARQYINDGLEAYRSIDHIDGTASSLVDLGRLDLDSAELTSARRYGLDSLRTYEQIGDRTGAADARLLLGEVALAAGDLPAARELLGNALATYDERASRERTVIALETHVALALRLGHPRRALRLAGAAAAWRRSVRFKLAPVEARRLEREIADARAALAPDAAERAWQDGQQLTLADAVIEALGTATGAA